MATEDDRDAPTTHTAEDWDAQRANFHKCYMERKLSLSETTAFMAKHFGFHATKRQWERKAKEWKFFKYVRPETRWKQVEVGQSGDRNLSRFVRRHNRSPSPHPATRSPVRSRPPSRARAKSTSAIDNPGYEYISPAALATGQPNLYVDGGDLTHSQTEGMPSSQLSDFSAQFAGLNTTQPFDSTGLNDTAYNVFMRDDVYDNIAHNELPDHFQLEATRADADSESSPAQLHVVTDPNAIMATPQVHLTMFDDYSAQLMPPVPLDFDDHVTTAPQYGQLGSWTNSLAVSEQTSGASSMISGDEYLNSQSAVQVSSESQEAPYSDTVNPYEVMPATVGHQGLDTSFINQSRQAMTEAEAEMSDDEDDLPETSDLHRLDTDFLLRVSDYTKSVKRIVKAFAKVNNVKDSELEKLKNELNESRVSFADAMKLRLESLEASRQRIIRSDLDIITRLRAESYQLNQTITQQNRSLVQQDQTITELRQENAMYQRFISGEDMNGDQGPSCPYPGIPVMDQSEMF